MIFGFPRHPSFFLSDDLHAPPKLDIVQHKPAYHMLFRHQPNGNLLISRHVSKTTDETVSAMQNFALEPRAIIQGHLPPPLERTSIRGSTGYDTDLNVRRDSVLAAAGQITWLESLLRSSSPVYYVVFQRISITENDLINFLQSSPFLNALVVWEPVDSSGQYIPIVTDKIINCLIHRDMGPEATEGNGVIEISSKSANRNILPNLTYLELNGSLAFDPTTLVKMLKSRCSSVWHRTGIGLVPSVQLRSLCLHYREASMDPSTYAEVHVLFSQEDREVFIYEDGGPAEPMEEQALDRELSMMFATYIDPTAYVAS